MNADFADITAFAYASPDKGSQNQIIDALNAIAEITGVPCDMSKAFLMPEDVSDVSQLRETVLYSKLKIITSFAPKYLPCLMPI